MSVTLGQCIKPVHWYSARHNKDQLQNVVQTAIQYVHVCCTDWWWMHGCMTACSGVMVHTRVSVHDQVKWPVIRHCVVM